MKKRDKPSRPYPSDLLAGFPTAGESNEDVVDVDAVTRYFVVHNFLCSFDSYTGSIIHNDYLYKKDGQLSMLDWILSDETYLATYHEYFSEVLSLFFESGYTEVLITSTTRPITSYVEEHPTAFCTYEEFESGVEALAEFYSLRAESIRGQLDSTVPSTY
ncbi:MAG: CotH kinase family protein [Clostridia bacterium]|nr:CotH kinase family protein [Clostridia bacterium]